MILMYLSNSERSPIPWTLIGTTVRLARSIKLQRKSTSGHNAPSILESSIRRSLRWLMLHMNHEFSIAPDGPLGISGERFLLRIRSQCSNRTQCRLRVLINRFTNLSRQIADDDDLLSLDKNINYTNELMELWDTIPPTLQFSRAWMSFESKVTRLLNIMAASTYRARAIFNLEYKINVTQRFVQTSNHHFYTSAPNAIMILQRQFISHVCLHRGTKACRIAQLEDLSIGKPSKVP